MDITFTSSFISEDLIRTALSRGSYGAPSQKSLEFIRNFASSMCVVGK